jgi:N-acetylglucosamine malate deacetylase 1
MNQRKILVIAPHTDDGEFGCGGSTSKFIQEGAVVFYAAFSLAEESVPEGFPKNILESEVKAATNILGIRSENLLLFKYQVRHFAYHRQEILEDLVKLNKEILPNLVFLPCLHDLHQDHSTIAIEGLRAFKKTSILGYEIPWNNMNFATQCFIPLDEKNLLYKINSLNCYKSQKHKEYASENFIRSLAITRGIQIGKPFAEAFETIRWIL